MWRAAQWYPDLVSHVFSVCTPYTAPHREYFSTEDLVKGQLPQFAYQLHLASGEVEKSVKDEQSIRQFLKGMYGAKGPKGEIAFDPEKGVLGENLPSIGESKVLNGKVRDDLSCCNACRVRDRGKKRVGLYDKRLRYRISKVHHEMVGLLDMCITTSVVSCRKDGKAFQMIGLPRHEHTISCVGRVEVA